MGKTTSINIKPAKIKISEAHNERRVKLDYVMLGLSANNESWKTELIADRLKKVHELYFERVGQKLQEKATPIREGVVVIKPETSLEDLRTLGRKFKEEFGVECFQCHIHRDEGHIVTKEEVRKEKALGNDTLKVGQVILNYHAHLVFDWQNKTTGRSIKLNKGDMRRMQTITASVLGMERGKENSKAVRLEVNEFKAFREKLNEDVAEELDRTEELKAKAQEELRLIEEQKKNSLNELRRLEAKAKEEAENFEKYTMNFKLTSKRLKDSRMELKKLEPKFALLRKLEILPWQDCTFNNVRWWLSSECSIHDVQIKSGQDGSIYFQQNDSVARVKDMPKEVQTVIKEKLADDRIFQKLVGVKGRKHRPQSFQH
ncbi:MAG: hypothetical protein JSS79_10250 [Bacteroidetes bacterium]|nr:hypothetical protein [Bacteroidota bacterium]